jgi:hypothetical protein
MYEDDIRFYDPMYIRELEGRELPLVCPYRQMVPSPPITQRPPVPHGPQGGPPSSPPSFIPTQPQGQSLGAAPLAVDSGAIRPCLFRAVYIWPRRGRGFWAWLTFVGPRSLAGFRWNRNSWRYFGMDLRNISSFQCF